MAHSYLKSELHSVVAEIGGSPGSGSNYSRNYSRLDDTDFECGYF